MVSEREKEGVEDLRSSDIDRGDELSHVTIGNPISILVVFEGIVE